jgi:hypothetical protein
MLRNACRAISTPIAFVWPAVSRAVCVPVLITLAPEGSVNETRGKPENADCFRPPVQVRSKILPPAPFSNAMCP